MARICIIPSRPVEVRICDRLSLEQAMKTLKREERQIVNLKIMGELTFRGNCRNPEKNHARELWHGVTRKRCRS